jgi:hypothetical protein
LSFLADSVHVEKLRSTIRKNNEIFTGQLARLLEENLRDQPHVIWVDYTAYLNDSSQNIRKILEENKNAIVVLANHETERNAELDQLQEMLPANYKERVLTANIDKVIFKTTVPSLLKEAFKKMGYSEAALSEEYMRKISSEKLWLVWDSRHRELYEQFPYADVAVSIVLGQQGPHILTDAERKKLESVGIKGDITSLLPEIEIGREHAKSVRIIMKRTLRAK